VKHGAVLDFEFSAAVDLGGNGAEGKGRREMHPDLEKLIMLQAHDVEAKRLRDEMAALPKHVASLESKEKATEGQRAVVVDLIAKEEALRRRQESDVKDHQAKIARIRKQMDLATTTVQVTAFEHEIAFAQAEISKVEDAEIESMERSEGLESQRRLADEALVDATATLERERVRATETIALDKTLLADVEEKRKAERAEIGEAALSIYDRIAKAKGTAVAEALNQQCMACQMMLRPQRWNDLRDRNNEETMMTCESCGRLLYYDPARDSPQRKTVPVESIAASIIRSL
jgi:predicted  nucleic acid-binding Zn-ribbon protein